MKRVYLDIAGKMHSLYNSLVSFPPDGYEFVTSGGNWNGLFDHPARIGPLYAFQSKFLSKVLPVNLAKAYIERFKRPPKDTSLTHATGHLVFRKEPWVVDLEFATQLAGYRIKHFRRHRATIEKMLASGYCKKIICWTESCKKTLLFNMNCKDFADKIEVVHLSVTAKHFSKDYGNKKNTRLLFVGSVNIPGEFEYKGGKEVLEAFAVLRHMYPHLEMVIRSDIPAGIRARYQGLDNLRIIDRIISRDELEREFTSADIFLFPTHATPGLAFLDAMSYELPIVTTNVWANPEMVVDGKNGFLINRSAMVPYYVDNFIPNWEYLPGSQFMRCIKTVDAEVVRQLVEKTTVLIENKELRRNMGRAGRQEIDHGTFSIRRRNEKLKRIFDEAVGRNIGANVELSLPK